ncbi:Uncharacterised protein [Bordetella pertussis]|nr:Uncharacterised protein [Bordetella pertussis]CFO75325.1 Uncharacterised protein [Bordetella pertussis]CFU85276.1 Uncharacterised protein [Bordetella pertussis]CPI34732.1 Uncharacterised protein [Bordetella pertussis]CPL24167.1 Uncharacterised protein [Bordetella pertussis]
MVTSIDTGLKSLTGSKGKSGYSDGLMVRMLIVPSSSV